MKNSVIRLICLMLTITPMVAGAQSNIKAAFDAIIKCSEATIEESHSLNRVPETNVKTGQCDVYHFTIPLSKKNLIKNVIAAFEKDSKYAYTMESGHAKRNASEIRCAIGSDGVAGIIVNNPDTDYYYELFLAPKSEDPDGIYRYAYGINYKESNGNIVGKLFVTYATTLQYRQKSQNSISFSQQTTNVDKSWLENFMYFINMIDPGSNMSAIYATKAYNLVSGMDTMKNVSAKDKKFALDILKGKLKKSSDFSEAVETILHKCEEALQ